jgi:hypothetical protein
MQYSLKTSHLIKYTKMGIISEYPIDATPQLADKAIGTSLTGPPDNTTVNFTFQSILDLFLPEITLQTVLDAGNSATQDIDLDGNISVTGSVSAEYMTISDYLNVANNILADSISVQTVQTNDLYANEDIRANGVWIGSNGIASNTRVGRDALLNTTGISVVAIGYQALKSNTTGQGNSSIGYKSMEENTIGQDNTAFGNAALRNNISGDNNTAIGAGAMVVNSTGSDNTAVGTDALFNNSIGTSNTAVGGASLRNNTGGSYNVAYGERSAIANTTGNYNIAIGYQALATNTIGSDNVFVGAKTFASSNANQNVCIGNDIVIGGVSVVNSILIGHGVANASSNTVVIGNNAILKTILKGTINMANLPIVSTGLVSGDLWRNGTVVNIIP